MKVIPAVILLIGLFLNVSSTYRGNDFFQVISSHPHDLEELQPYIDTVYQNGRLWVVQLKHEAPLHVMEHLRPLEGGEKSYLHEVTFTQTPQMKKKDRLKTLVDTINVEAIRQDIIDLASYRTRAVGTIENQDAVTMAIERFLSMGFETRRICYSANACSVIAEKKGSRFPDKVIMVMGHIDSIGATYAGADDNASGAAVLMEMANVLKAYDNKKTLRFFVTNGEETGLQGSAHYARLLSSENTLKNLDLVINMDMIGYNKNGIVEIETGAEFEPLAKWYADIAARYTKLKPKITIGAWGSDHVPFLRRGVPSVLTIQNWDTKNPCYHQACDTPDTVNFSYAAEIGKMNLAAVLRKDQI